MIIKERLEELIEQGATIYVLNNKVVFEEKLNKHYTHDILKDCICWWGIPRKRWFFTDLFETKEDAEEYAEFGNITRTEKLPYMNWEEFLKNNTGIHFFSNGYEYGLHKVRYSDDDVNPDWRVEVYVLYYDLEESSNELFSKPLTRENYNEARRLCVKLFKGEEV